MKEDVEMAVNFRRKNNRYNIVIYTIITVILLCTVFLSMVSYFYSKTEEEEYEKLHVQTKQIKDNLTLQIISDRENLITMANFAAKLYVGGEDYSLLFESFKPIGLIENIGILMPDNTFVTKAGSIALDGRISFEEEKAKGEYISGRIKDLTKDNYEIIRSAVPIKVNGEVVGVLYGVIKLDEIGSRYNEMVKEIDAQLFVYDNLSGNLVIDTVHNKLGNIEFLKDRKYNGEYSYEQFRNSDKGFSSFVSAYRPESLYMHHSIIEELGWVIAMGRYDSQVFAKTHSQTNILLIVFFIMIVIMSLYLFILMINEKNTRQITDCASEIRMTLLETAGEKNHIREALKQACLFAKSRSAFFFNTDGEDYNYVAHQYNSDVIKDGDKKELVNELFSCASEIFGINQAAVNIICIKRNKKLENRNPKLHRIMNKHNIKEIACAAVVNKENYITIMGVLNPKKSKSATLLAEKVAVCFSIALYNKNHLSKTELAATTDSLTGALNRVAYKRDLATFDKEKLLDFSCIYIDVNELHLINNKYGHAAGDEMLLFIANTLKEVFFGHKVYRMGGDEFLVFANSCDQETIKNGINKLTEQLKPRNYHVAVGLSFRKQNTNTEEMVREAEIRMYEAKAQYYQNKEYKTETKTEENEYVQLKTGIDEIDTMISVLKENYNGIYRVSLKTDKASRILMPSYLSYNENEDHYSKLFTKYVTETVDSAFHRAMLSFMNYESIKKQLIEGNVPKIRYKKLNGETVVLSVYKLNANDNLVENTLWVFAKD